jgi:very-short-patch-repair endonuclease
MHGDRAGRGQRRIAVTVGEQCDVDSDIRGQRRTAGSALEQCDEIRVARVLAALAARQDGVVARAQLVARGIGGDVIDRLVAAGSLIPLYRGVYAVGHRAVGERGLMRAALFAAGVDAVLSHWTAARGWVLVRSLASPLHVIVVGRRPRSRAGLIIHADALDPRDRRMRDGLALTSPARTLLDLAAQAPADVVVRALREARVAGLVRDGELAAVIDRAPAQHRGRRRLDALSSAVGAEPTRSELERTLLRLIDDAGLPRPLVNHRHGGAMVDFTWPDHRVIVEVDGWAAHGDKSAFEHDRARDAQRQARGDVVLRFTWRQVNEQPLRVIARIAQTLGVRTPS